MIEIRFHGRGGQGSVVASRILATSIFLDGKYSQSFPAFGVERRGAPVTAFLRVDDKPIRIRTEIYEPDHIVILDPLLVDQVPLADGLKKEGIVIINSSKKPDEFSDKFKGFHVATVPAGKTGYLTKASMSVGSGKECTFKARIRNGLGGSFSVKYEVTLYESAIQQTMSVPFKITEKLDICLTAKSSLGTVKTNGSFGIVLVDN